MLISLIQWLILVIIVCLLYWLASMFAPAQILRIVMVVCVIIVVVSAIVIFLLPLAHLNLH